MKQLEINGRELYVLDNVYSYSDLQFFMDVAQSSIYNFVTNADGNHDDYPKSPTFLSKYTITDIDKIQFVKKLPQFVIDKFDINLTPENFHRAIMNAICLGQVYHPHTDDLYRPKNCWSMLFYPHLKWDIEWGGETLFLNEERDDIEYAVHCKPNRMVIFNASIPHLIRPPTLSCPNNFRYSFNMVWGGES